MVVEDSDLENAIEELEALFVMINAADIDDEPEDFEILTGQQIPVREDQIANNAGGFVFRVTDEMRVRRFLVLGTKGGTYYASQSEVQKDNVEDLIRIINEGKGHIILREAFEIVKDNRAPKRQFAIYATALCARYNTKDWQIIRKTNQKADKYLENLQKMAFQLVPHVCRISTDLFMFMKFAEEISREHNNASGWGRMMRGCIAQWYLKRSPKTLAIQLTKYKNRCGYTHRDALRLCHADPHKQEDQDILYDYLFHHAIGSGKSFDERYPQDKMEKLRSSDVFKFLEATVKASKLKVEDAEECAKLIREHRLVREHITTDLLNNSTVWEALLERMPMTAMIRNLSKMSVLGLITGEKDENKKWVQLVVDNLTSGEKIAKAGIHPFSVLLAKTVYERGQGVRGSLTFKTNPVVLDALEKAFLMSFKNVQPTNKRFLLALDVSGSMTSPMAGSVLKCIEAEAAMSMITLRTEPNTEVVAFSSGLTRLEVNQNTTFQQMNKAVFRLNFSNTDCSLPMVWAKKEGKKFDVFVVYTDNETYYGDIHPFEALKQYREASGISDAKLVVVAFTGTKFTIADPTDPNMLDVVGFDSASPALISEFIRGRL